mmetsp:Transcript_128097/g.362618  ORF Transcript_128097/g.362618 Transcript_128097/m.362618 type:complete len:342 (+) Transcript_128097:59-1084(+)
MPRAIVVHKEGPYQGLKVEDVKAMEPHAGTVVVRVLSCGFAFPDILTIGGTHIFKPPVPFIPGREICGVVTAVGPGVKRLRVGDRVFGSGVRGGISEEAEIMETNAYPLPDGVAPEIGAGFELNYGTTYHGLVDLGGLRSGEVLLVLGASGGVGAAAIDLGKALGATVIACASSEEKLAFCRDAGADYTINYEQNNLRDALKKLGMDGKVDMVYDPVGGQWSEPALRSLGWGGRFLVVGFAAGGETPKDAIPKMPLNLALLNERQIQGVLWGGWKARDQNRKNAENIATMMKMVQEGKLKPVISRVYPMEAGFVQACDDIMSRRVMGKVCLDPNAAPAARL